MNYVIDTDILIYFLKGNKLVLKRFVDAVPGTIHISIVNHAELMYGAHHSQHKKKNLQKVSAFLESMPVLPFCKASSNIFGELKSKLNKEGASLADMDLIIASICLQNNMVLVTNNTKHFARVSELTLDNWSKKT